jgi:thiamine biosynthesis lipoprotein
MLLLVGCALEKSISRTQVIMGTFCTLTFEDKNSQFIDIGFTHLKELESILSSYQEDSPLSRLNTKHTVATNETLKDVLKKSKMYHTQTQGYFDITIGSITKKLYHFGEDETIPTKEEMSQAILDIDSIHIEEKYIHLKGDISIDLGGIAKGYGVDSLASLYTLKGIQKAKIALSGDIRCMSSCDIAIQSPFYEEKYIGTLHAKIDDLSVSTSGTYRRYVKEKKHHHLISPKSKFQGKSFVSVSIVSKANNTLCDVMATAISTMPHDVALAFVKSQKTFGYLLVTPKGEIIQGNLEKFADFNHSP